MEETMTRRLTVGAAAAALIFVVTLFVKVPIPLGYANLGDGVIFLAAVFLPRKEAALAAAVGSALADLMGGFPVWIIPTLIIKYGMVEIVARTARDRTSWDGAGPHELARAVGHPRMGAGLCVGRGGIHAGRGCHLRESCCRAHVAPGALSVKCGEYGRGLCGGFLRRGDALFRQIKKDPFFFRKRGSFIFP